MRLIITLVFLSTVIGCSRGRVELLPLSLAQKNEFKDATGRLAATITAVSSGVIDSYDPGLSIAQVFWFAYLHRRNHLDTSWLGLGSNQGRNIHGLLRDRVRAAIRNGDCRVKIPAFLKTGTGGLANFYGIQSQDLSLELYGELCPLPYKEDTSLRRSDRQLEGSQGRTYELRAEDLQAASGIRSITIKESGNFELSDELVTKPSTGEIEIDGTVDFRDYGKCDFWVILNGEATYRTPTADGYRTYKGVARYGIQFPKYAAELRAEAAKPSPVDSDTSEAFYVNDEPITSREFGEYLEVR